jgi:hypothetical protein
MLDRFALILEAHDARFGIHHLQRHLQHDAGFGAYGSTGE